MYVHRALEIPGFVKWNIKFMWSYPIVSEQLHDGFNVLAYPISTVDITCIDEIYNSEKKHFKRLEQGI